MNSTDAPKARLFGAGATTSHLSFETVEFPVFSRGVNDVTVTQCTMANPIQGISNWRGSGWEISHNVVSFNDLRGTVLSIVLTPLALDDINAVSRNLGAAPNRGHGLHPKSFSPEDD